MKKTFLSNNAALSSIRMFKGKRFHFITYPQMGNKNRFPILFPVFSIVKVICGTLQKITKKCNKAIIDPV